MIDELITHCEAVFDAPEHASSRLKSRILSSLVALEQAEGPLRTLAESESAGGKLCVFERLVTLLPSEDLQSRNPCRVCHARILAENVENPPIYWPGCPYVRFCNR
jgi:hypothetical protein